MLDSISSFVWGPVTIILLLGTGIFTTLLLKGVQVRHFFYGFGLLSGKYDNPEDKGEITHFQALSAALSATIGTGNIAGVGVAIASGGPGALFWMWVTAFFGMGLKFAEALLAVKYRVVHDDGSISAGPMYYLEHGLKQKWLGVLFAFFAAIASFGIGNMVQANSVAAPMLSTFNVPKLATGLIIAVLVFAVIVGGIKRIGHVASRMVPFMAFFYVMGALVVLVLHFQAIPTAFTMIFHDAFSGTAATGGFAGAAVAQAIRWGVARGLFSNEAGLGSAPIAHGAAQTSEPVREGLVAMLGPFIDTVIICTMTGLVIIVTGAYEGGLSGANLTAHAFGTALPLVGTYIVAISMAIFAFSTAVSWSYYGDRSVEYLFGEKSILPYRIFYCLLLPVGATFELRQVWAISDIFNALMAWPNLIGLLFLSGVVLRSTREYFADPGRMSSH